MDEVLNAILKDTYTYTHLKHRLRVLKSYLISKLFTSTPPPLETSDDDWLNSLQPNFYQQFNKDNVYQIFSDLEAKIAQSPKLLVYIPFTAPYQTVAQIGQFIRSLFGKDLLFDTKFNPDLIAGCAISWHGVYRDYSLRAKIDQRKGEILESFKKFLR